MQLKPCTRCFLKSQKCLGLEMVRQVSMRRAVFQKAAERTLFCQRRATHLEPSPKPCTHSPACPPPGRRASPQGKTLPLSTPSHPACISQWRTQWFLPGGGDRFWCLSLLCPLRSWVKNVPAPRDPAHSLVWMVLARRFGQTSAGQRITGYQPSEVTYGK